MVVSLLGQQGKWVPYKHLYYELQDVMFCGGFEILINFPFGVILKFVIY
jgi:hypothetical protein